MRTAFVVVGLALLFLGRVLTAEEIRQIDRLLVGAEFTLTGPAGDDCNTCDWSYRKVSETEIQAVGYGVCTLLACVKPFPIEKYRESTTTPKENSP